MQPSQDPTSISNLNYYFLKRPFTGFQQNKYWQEKTCPGVFSNEIAGLQLLLKRKLRHGCFAISFEKSLRTTFLWNTSG